MHVLTQFATSPAKYERLHVHDFTQTASTTDRLGVILRSSPTRMAASTAPVITVPLPAAGSCVMLRPVPTLC